MAVVITKERTRWALLGAYTGGLVGLGVALSHGVKVMGALARVDLVAPSTLRSLAAIVWAPIAWNVVPRLEFRHRLLSRLVGGNRSIAHYLFAVYIVIFSSIREKLFFEAISAAGDDFASSLAPSTLSTLRIASGALLAFGGALSVAGFYHLRIRFTYMGEYFGFRMNKLVTSFPFNFFPDPMYNGSVLMHFGYALRAASPAGLFLACATGLSYWTAAKIFEEPFMHYCYSGEAEKDATKSD